MSIKINKTKFTPLSCFTEEKKENPTPKADDIIVVFSDKLCDGSTCLFKKTPATRRLTRKNMSSNTIYIRYYCDNCVVGEAVKINNVEIIENIKIQK